MEAWYTFFSSITSKRIEKWAIINPKFYQLRSQTHSEKSMLDFLASLGEYSSEGKNLCLQPQKKFRIRNGLSTGVPAVCLYYFFVFIFPSS